VNKTPPVKRKTTLESKSKEAARSMGEKTGRGLARLTLKLFMQKK